MKAPFFKRLAAYIIDIIIVSTIVLVICTALPNKDKENENKLQELSTQLMNKEIDVNKYMNEYQDLIYSNNKNEIIELTINLVITIAYFVVFQYMNKGQTIGKKLLKIKVIDNNTKKEVSIIKGLLRSILVFNIISSTVSVSLINILSKKTYMSTYLTINEIETIFIIVTAILILYRKDGRGLHDMIANTMVITEER